MEPQPRPSTTSAVIGYFLLGLVLALLVATLLPSTRQGNGEDEDASAERIAPAADLALAPQAFPAGKRSGAALAQESCLSCHGKGLGGAPKIGDKKAWTPRLDQGLEGLVRSVSAGKCAMPQQGGMAASDKELARAIVYMIWPRMRL